MTTLTLPVINSNQGSRDEAICRECGGVCCQQSPGIAHPRDFGPKETFVDVVCDYLSTGFWAIDCWEGDIRKDKGRKVRGEELCQVWYVRPAEVQKKGQLIDRSWGGTCILWSKDHGCSLLFHNRPFQCRMLKPNALRGSEQGCIFPKGSSKPDVVMSWVPYQSRMEIVIERMRASS